MQQNALSTDMVARIRALALEQVSLMDELEAAVQSDDVPRMKELARQLVGLERAVEQQ